MWKTSSLPEFDPRTIQPIEKNYTIDTIPAHEAYLYSSFNLGD
jgi:hypothetical protein